eukprot:TRINITY_DN13731_c0_g1_i2.p1 TRINITY_DN13731_c0_g1~~TRINITY_DN13731_c0_g1_i2.p1  ORF type:complete len:121 (+),score=4.81 TRINITY_DN13731_c0_g1_i2:159-521(+)
MVCLRSTLADRVQHLRLIRGWSSTVVPAVILLVIGFVIFTLSQFLGSMCKEEAGSLTATVGHEGSTRKAFISDSRLCCAFVLGAVAKHWAHQREQQAAQGESSSSCSPGYIVLDILSLVG